MTLYERSQKVIAPVAARATKIGVIKGEGSYLYTEDGKKYLDFSSGVAVCNVGHANPKVVEAAINQIKKIIHAGHNVVYYPVYVELAEKLVELTGNDTMVYFSNSGAEANEGSIKLAKYVNKRPAIVAFKGAFHGRTLGTISITTSNSAYRKNYEGLLPSVYFAEYPYCFRCPFKQKYGKCGMECLEQFNGIFKQLIDPESIAAIIIEPEAGEGGYIPVPKEFMVGLRKICDKYGISLIFDEIQSSFGRTGKMFAYEHFGVKPDIMSCAKAIASGFPLSVVIAKAELMKKWPAGAHGGTFGGNPVSCAASLATIELLKNGLLKNASKMGRYLKEKVKELQGKYSVIGDVRGLGLMIGIEMVDDKGDPNPEVVNKLTRYSIENGLIMLSCGTYKNVLRFIPPTSVSKEEIDEAVKIIEVGLKNITS